MMVYLAGPIFQCEDHECRHWREEVKKRLPEHVILDPMERDYRGQTDECFREIVEEDKTDIDRCGVLLVNYLKPSVGTSMEILYAWERGKHVVVVNRNSEISPWMLYHSHRVCRSLDEAITYVKDSDGTMPDSSQP